MINQDRAAGTKELRVDLILAERSCCRLQLFVPERQCGQRDVHVAQLSRLLPGQHRVSLSPDCQRDSPGTATARGARTSRLTLRSCVRVSLSVPWQRQRTHLHHVSLLRRRGHFTGVRTLTVSGVIRDGPLTLTPLRAL